MTEFLLVLLYSLLFLLIINKISFYNLQGVSRFLISSAFILKIFTGYLLYLIYSRYYTDRSTADIFKYFDDSKIMFEAFFDKPLDFIRMMTGFGNDSPYFDQYYHRMNNWCGIYPSNVYGDGHLMIRFNALLRIFSFGYYNVHTVFMSFLSFSGLIGLYKVFSKKLQHKNLELFILLFFFPSLLFWSSGVLKEGLIFLSIGMCLYIIDLMKDTKFNPFYFLLLVFLFMILRYTKFYLFIILLPLSLGYLWTAKHNCRYLWFKYLSILFLFLLLGIIVGQLYPVYDVIHIIARKQHDFLQLALKAGSGSIIAIQPIEESFKGIITGIIPGFSRAFFMPYPWDIRNFMMIIPALENLFFMVAIIITAFYFKKPENSSLFIFCVLFFFFVFTLSGMMTSVIGAMVRYRSIAIPFLFSALLLILDKEKIKKIKFR